MFFASFQKGCALIQESAGKYLFSRSIPSISLLSAHPTPGFAIEIPIELGDHF